MKVMETAIWKKDIRNRVLIKKLNYLIPYLPENADIEVDGVQYNVRLYMISVVEEKCLATIIVH